MKKIFSIVIAVCLAVLFSVSAIGCGKKYVKGSLAIDEEKQVLAVGEKVSITAIFTPENPEEDLSGVAFQWHSNRKQVATVDETGLVTGVAPGFATITVSYGSLSVECDVTVFDPNAREVVELEFSRINVSRHQNKMEINLRKELSPHFTKGEKLVSLLDDDGEPISYTQDGDTITLDWMGTIGMHNWLFCTASKVIEAEVCHATHIISRLSDFGALNDDWDAATVGNLAADRKVDNDTNHWYIALGADIDGEWTKEYIENYHFGRNYATDGGVAVFNGTFDGRGYTISGLRTQRGLITNLGPKGVIQNVAFTGTRCGETGGGGVFGYSGYGKIKNVFIDAWLYFESQHQSGMYLTTDSETPLSVENCIVFLEIKQGATSWPSVKNYPGVFTTQGSAINWVNSYGISSFFTRSDGTKAVDTDRVFTSYEAFLESGAFSRFGGIWEVGQNNIFFAGKPVYTKR